MSVINFIIENLGIAISVVLSLVVLIYAIQEIETFMGFSYPVFIPSTIIQFVLTIIGPIFICYLLATDSSNSQYFHTMLENINALFSLQLSYEKFAIIIKYAVSLYVLLYNWGIYLAISWYEPLLNRKELFANLVSIYFFAIVAFFVAFEISFLLPFMLIAGFVIAIAEALRNYIRSFRIIQN